MRSGSNVKPFQTKLLLIHNALDPDNKTIMKRINIYITRTEKDKADKVCKKNLVSLSTLTDVTTYWLFYFVHHYGTQEQMKMLSETYIAKENNYKTSIKPKLKDEYLGQILEEPSKWCSNALKIYLNHEIDKYLTDEKQINRYYSKINEQLQKTKEIHWNYNAVIRQQRRSMRENKEYWKKVLEC